MVRHSAMLKKDVPDFEATVKNISGVALYPFPSMGLFTRKTGQELTFPSP
jgi:hypothetical protein